MVNAFSREGPKKVYVQHRLKERSKDINELLQQKAYVYVCGDAANMAREVNTVLGQIIAEERGIPEAKGEEIIKNMRAANQYQVPPLLPFFLSAVVAALTHHNRRMSGHEEHSDEEEYRATARRARRPGYNQRQTTDAWLTPGGGQAGRQEIQIEESREETYIFTHTRAHTQHRPSPPLSGLPYINTEATAHFQCLFPPWRSIVSRFSCRCSDLRVGYKYDGVVGGRWDRPGERPADDDG